MLVNCLFTQEGFFETRLLKRTFDPVFLDLGDLPSGQTGPLVLYGQWYTSGLDKGMRWLAKYAFDLPHPCILLPPFNYGSLSEALGLPTSLIVQMVNTNRISVLTEANKVGFSQELSLEIQTDFAFSGTTGKAWFIAGGTDHAALLCIQPKNTSTPLLLCGARLLSASGLSNDNDRLKLLEGIVSWGETWQQPLPAKQIKPAEYGLDDALWHVICIVLTGCKLKRLSEVAALSSSLFGVEISQTEMQWVTDRLVELDLAQHGDADLELKLEKLEIYTQQHDLWAYVRALRKDFERMNYE